MDLLLIRHGQPERQELDDGDVADPPLTDLGRQQAAAVADLLTDENVTHIAASPVRRARETAAPSAARLGIDVSYDPRLEELDYGSASYIPNEQAVASDDKWAEYDANPLFMFDHHGGFDVFRDRVVSAFDDLVASHRGQTVAVFSHGGVMGTYIMSIVGYDWPFTLQNDYCGLTRVRAASSGFRSVQSVNETLHVRGLMATRDVQ